jgi:DNA-binding ferritin-like protein
MIGNKYSGDNIAKEFFKLSEIKKTASEQSSYESYVEDEVVSPEDFLQTVEKNEDLIEKELDSKIEDLGFWEDVPAQSDAEDCKYEASSEDSQEFLDEDAKEVLEGLGKIAGSLRLRGENFAADLVEATAFGIKSDIVKQAGEKMEVINTLNKIASEISAKGDSLTADVVKVTINKIKNS